MNKTSITILLFTLVIWSCKGPQVISFTNPAADFGTFNTYRIVSPREGEPSAETDTSSINKEIENLIKSEVEVRGYKYNRRADVRVQYNFIANNKTDIDVNPDPYYRRSVYSPYNNPYRYYEVRSRNFYEAILLIELKNTKTAKTVWQGSLDLRYTKKIENKSDILPNAISKIFDTYPFKAGSNEPLFPLGHL